MTDTPHSPLPWHLKQVAEIDCFHLVDSNSRGIYVTKENCLFIVKCVNGYPDLEAENAILREALTDALSVTFMLEVIMNDLLRKPKGIVPKSADEFYCSTRGKFEVTERSSWRSALSQGGE